MLRNARKLLIGSCVGGVLAFGGLSGFAVWSARAVRTSVEWSEHTHQVLLSIERLRHLRLQSNVEGRSAAELGLRLLRGEDSDLQIAINKERAELTYLQRLVAGNPQQRQAARELSDLTERQLRLQYARVGEPPSAAAPASDNAAFHSLRTRIRDKAHQLSETEQTLSLAHQELLEREIDRASWSAFAGALWALLIVLSLLWALNREIGESARFAGALARSERRLAATLDSIGDAVISTDAKGRVATMNPVAAALTGWSSEEARGAPVADVLHLRTDQGTQRAPNFISDGPPSTDGRPLQRTVLLSKSGASHDVEDFATPIRQADGSDSGAVIVVRDMTRERMWNEQFRRLLQAAPDAMLIADEAGSILHANDQASRMFGWSSGELLAKTTDELLPKRVRDELRARFLTTRAVRGSIIPEAPNLALVAQRKDGSEFHAAMSVSPMRSAGRVLSIIALRDVTQEHASREALRVARERLEVTNRELEAFSYSVAHDLRAPLRQMDGFAKALRDDYGKSLDDQGMRYLSLICEAAEHMGSLIEDLLELSRVTQTSLVRAPLDLGDVARQVVHRLRLAEPERTVEVSLQEPLPVLADPRLLSIALDNLLSNAWKFTRKNQAPRIELGSRQCDGELQYFVRDNGAGFDMTRARKLFVPFQRLHRQSDYEGTGIGLATVRRIINRHHGRVGADGRVGEGATFWFTLGEEASRWLTWNETDSTGGTPT